MAFKTTSAIEADLSASLFPQIGYIVYYKKNVEDLASKVEDLSSMRNYIEWNVRAAKRSGATIYQVVDRWLNKVDRIQYDSNKVIDVASGIKNCFQGWCCARHVLSKRAKKLVDMVIELLLEGKNFTEVPIHAPIQNIGLMPTEGIEAFESTKKATDLVMKALMNDQINIIGVHGMGGVGKTTLMRKIGNQVKLGKLFDAVIMVTVSRNHDLERIQDEIAEDLCFSFGKEKGESRARRLFTRLKHERRVLIILDDIWKPLDLIEVGIPFGEYHKGGKVVLTTRMVAVCSRMKSQVTIQLGCLSDLESWNLFRMSAGIDVDSPILSEVARDVARECKGLPVALVGLGRTMRGKDQMFWKIALQILREPEIEYADIIDADTSVFQTINLSYACLPFEETKLIFLFCCLFPDNCKIGFDVLLMYMIGEGIYGDVNLKQAKRRLLSMVDHLTSLHLLLKADREGFVLMHDVIWDVAIIIASKGHGFVVKRGRGLEAWPKEELKNCVRLSLMGSEVSKLPERPECPAIKTLTLSGCRSLKNIPDSFFEGMKSLLNLDLSHTSISALPSSLLCLVNLRCLRLDHCYALKDITLIGKLEKLEMISLRKTAINTLPVRDIREFSNLQWLCMES